MLERDNWGGVWRDIAINPTRLRPAWLVPIRLAAKLAHVPLGQASVRKAVSGILDSAARRLCRWPYWRVARDRRAHNSAIGWHIEAYLERKGQNWTGAPLEAGQHPILGKTEQTA